VSQLLRYPWLFGLWALHFCGQEINLFYYSPKKVKNIKRKPIFQSSIVTTLRETINNVQLSIFNSFPQTGLSWFYIFILGRYCSILDLFSLLLLDSLNLYHIQNCWVSQGKPEDKSVFLFICQSKSTICHGILHWMGARGLTGSRAKLGGVNRFIRISLFLGNSKWHSFPGYFTLSNLPVNQLTSWKGRQRSMCEVWPTSCI